MYWLVILLIICVLPSIFWINLNRRIRNIILILCALAFCFINSPVALDYLAKKTNKFKFLTAEEFLINNSIKIDNLVVNSDIDVRLRRYKDLTINYCRNNKWNKAVEFYEYIVLSETEFGDKEKTELLFNLALGLYHHGKGNKAEIYYGKFIDLNRRMLEEVDRGGVVELADALTLKAMSLEIQGDYNLAEKLYNLILENITEKMGKQDYATLEPLSRLASIYKKTSKLDESEILYNRALRTITKVLDSVDKAWADFIKSVEDQKTSDVYPIGIPVKFDKLDVAFILMDIAKFYLENGIYDDSEKVYKNGCFIL